MRCSHSEMLEQRMKAQQWKEKYFRIYTRSHWSLESHRKDHGVKRQIYAPILNLLSSRKLKGEDGAVGWGRGIVYSHRFSLDNKMSFWLVGFQRTLHNDLEFPGKETWDFFLSWNVLAHASSMWHGFFWSLWSFSSSSLDFSPMWSDGVCLLAISFHSLPSAG